ncbi:hypothetical protein [Parerythrobacter aestuarii]|uniref:hypothetical protein n=1 Tax=Parerythrobacter aestuarii TaxID=3020909 RepID=UPI0024DEA56B|nr:hypothetical protein [Parerythrobacter aestuarii]
MVDVPGISFPPAPAPVAADPNRMDIAMFVGFLPLRAGAEAEAARLALTAQLAQQGWADRANPASPDLLDLPVRVRSIEDVELLFDTGGRLDRQVAIESRPLEAEFELSAVDATFVVNLDGEDQQVELPTGTVSRTDIRDALAAGLDGVEVSILPAVGGKAPLQFRRASSAPGSLTVSTHPALGFPVAAFDQSQGVGAPMGVALRSFFASGGREAVIVRMGDPPPLYGSEADRVAALATLVGYGFGDSTTSIAELLDDTVPELPGAFPTRTPWHGLAHLLGLPDVAMVLLPDLPELVASVPGLVREAEALPRPPETFQPCAPEPVALVQGALAESKPASVDADGLELWSRIAAWAGEQVARISPEVMVLCALPLIDEDAGPLTALDAMDVVTDGNSGAGMANRQLQLVTPWITSDLAFDLPAGATPADGLLAGHIAASTLAAGAWRTVAGRRLAASQFPYGALEELSFDRAEQISVIGYGARGPTILSDRTTELGTYNQANIRRLTALILRAARIRGESVVFEANGELFWRDTRMVISTLLRQLHSAGALRGQREEEAFQVRCGRDTMSQADIDAGRAIAEVTFAPAHSIEFIEVSLLATNGTIAPGLAAQGRIAA